MSIDEAIRQFKYDAECNRADLDLSYAEDNEQIAEWLEELKDYRDKNKMVVRVDVENMDSIKDKIEELSKYAERQYNKAIDDFVKKICEKYTEEESKGNYKQYCVEFKQNIADIAEQLKE